MPFFYQEFEHTLHSIGFPKNPVTDVDILHAWRISLCHVTGIPAPQVPEKYARQNGFIFPNFRGENSKTI